MKNLKTKIITSILVLSLWLSSVAQATSDVKILPVPPIENDKAISKYFSKYGSILKNNTVKTDYKYNNKNFYTKKVLLNISIPKELKDELTEVYLILWNENNYYYQYYQKDMIMLENEVSNSLPKIVKEQDFKNVIKLKIDKNNIPKEYIFKLSDIEDKLNDNDKYWKSFSVKLYWKLKDWKEISLNSNNYNSLRFDVNSLESKTQFLRNKMYSKYGSSYANINKKLDSILKKIKSKYESEKYIIILDKINTKIISISEKIEKNKENIANSITTEKGFELKLKDFYINEMKIQTLYQIKSRIGREIKENKWDEMIEDIFWEY